MLAKQDSNIEKAVFAVHTLTQDERFHQQCEAREDFLRQQIDHDAWFENKFKDMLEKSKKLYVLCIVNIRISLIKYTETVLFIFIKRQQFWSIFTFKID
jgi:hypothetical protein